MIAKGFHRLHAMRARCQEVDRLVCEQLTELRGQTELLEQCQAERDALRAQCAAQAALLSAFQDGGSEANEAAREDLIEQLEAERDALKAENAAGCHALCNHTKQTS